MVHEQFKKEQERQKYYFDRKAREQSNINIGDTVKIRDKNNWEKSGVVVDKCERPRSYKVKTENDNVLERNRNHLLRGVFLMKI